jgi:chromosome segregation ATPase
MDDGLVAIARDLYGLPPAEFTAARNARATRTKAEGDAELAARVRALVKPSVAGWVVNLLVRQMPDRLGDLLALGEELQHAQEEMDGATLRTLTQQRRTLVAAVARQAAGLAAELGQQVSGTVTDQVQATLHAAMADARAASAIRTGLLLTPLSATGLDDVDLSRALAVGLDDAGELTAEPTPRAGREAPTDLGARRASARARAATEVTEAKAELAVAEAAAARTGKTLRARHEKVRGLQAQVLQLRSEIDELMREVGALEDRLEPLTSTLATAQDDDAEADAMDLAARAAVEKAQRRLANARGSGR